MSTQKESPRPEENLYFSWLDDESSDKKSLRTSILTAIVVHAVIFMITFPEIVSEVQAAERDIVFVVQETPRFEKPKPPPIEQLPQFKPTLVPMPDPDPDDPEPLWVDEPAELPDLPDFDPDLVIGIPQAPPAPPQEDVLHRVGGQIAPPERLRFVSPRYPEIARKAGVEGMVILQATINRQGDVVDVQVLRDLPLGLTEAAVEAVRQWKYEPSTLNGKPVSVLFNLTVQFSLR